jgi:hypothetical protein
MKNAITIFCLLLFVNAYAQHTLCSDVFEIQGSTTKFLNEQSIQCVALELPECPYNVENAKADILKESMSIVIHGGFVGFGNMDEHLTEQFQQKYHVQFVYLGCLRYWNTASEDTEGYNEVIFAHLEQQYGKIIRREFEQLWDDD